MARRYVSRYDENNKEEKKTHPSGTVKGVRDSSAPTVSDNPFERFRLKTVPDYRDSSGQVNPQYKSSRGADALQGFGMGVQAMRGGDPYQIVGAAIGGSLAGLFSKGIRGKARHEADIQDAENQNKVIIQQTDAMIRAEAYKERKDKDAFMKQQAIDRANRQVAVQEAKDDKVKREVLSYNIAQATTSGNLDEARMYQKQLAEMNGWKNLDDVPENYGVAMSGTPTKIGNGRYYTVKGTNTLLQAVDDNDNPIVDFTRDQWMKIAKEQAKANYSEQFADESFAEAVRKVEDFEKDGTFKFRTASGKYNNAQRNAYIKNFAEQLYKDKIDGKATTNLDLGFTYKSYSPTSMVPNVPAQKVAEANSQFMPNDTGSAPPVVDATNKSNTEVPEAFKGNPVDTFMETVKGMSTDAQTKINSALQGLQEGEEQDILMVIGGKKRTVTIRKVNGKHAINIQ